MVANVDVVWLVKPPTTATYEIQTLIGFINYDRLLALVFERWQNWKQMYIVELEKGVWLAPWQGDPGRTLKIENAKLYKRENWARYGLKMARKYRPFEKAKIKRVDECALAN